LVKFVSNYAVLHGCKKSGLGQNLIACSENVYCLYCFWFMVVSLWHSFLR